ncbi:MAG: hypothetical protein ABIZ05_17650 [Pseudonocardiaceae bacterium]
MLAALKPRLVVFAAASDPFDETIVDTEPSVTTAVTGFGVEAFVAFDVTGVGGEFFVTNTAPITAATPNDTTAVRVTTRLVPSPPPRTKTTTLCWPKLRELTLSYTLGQRGEGEQIGDGG